MRIVNFRDDVLWPIAYRLGLNPKFDLLADQATALASYINSWVRRLWDSADWPEWTFIDIYLVGASHYVTWDQLSIPTNGHSLNKIGKVLKVYLLDPHVTWAPVDTPFRLNNIGIHCGFEHGPHVWIKYVVRCPQYTSNVWNVGVTYNKDDLVYSPTTGECYESKSNNNLGHDPSEPGGSDGPLLPLGIAETPGTPDNPGSPASSAIEDVFAAQAFSTTPIADPPASGVTFFIEVKNDVGAVLGNATHAATGSESLLVIFTDLQTQLAAAIPSFTITLVTSPLKITIEHASNFVVSRAIFGTSTKSNLSVVQAQSFSAAVSAAAGTRQSLVLTIAEEQFIPGGIYTLTFTTVDSVQHIATYTAEPTDNVQQVLSGLIQAMIALQPTDDFFAGVHSSTDATSLTNTFLIENQLGMVSLDGQVQGQGSTYWNFVPFAFSLVEQVVRGAYADALGEQGMTDKKAPEEAAVKTEHDVRTGAFMAPKHDALTDQYQGEGKRYELP